VTREKVATTSFCSLRIRLPAPGQPAGRASPPSGSIAISNYAHGHSLRAANPFEGSDLMGSPRRDMSTTSGASAVCSLL
jgi:hypothetical protein